MFYFIYVYKIEFVYRWFNSCRNVVSILQSHTMAQMVKAVRMILGRESFGSLSKKPFKRSVDIEIEDDAPKRKPSLEEIDALEVRINSYFIYFLLAFLTRSALKCGSRSNISEWLLVVIILFQN